MFFDFLCSFLVVHYLGPSQDPTEAKYLALAARGFIQDSKGLGMILKASKSGAVVGSRKFWKGVQRHMGSMKIPYKEDMPLPRSGHRRLPAARPGHDRRCRLRFGP
ncbi:unnamed protein product [Prorocentrum cordatum]|uniref:Uncharacterized protein n=1 Tax=Prorocentrum cordatum TaxID=2364126 RepID=A0ABN9R2S2_9DINO|nr:unnamed protein product [Polarella glacialis]